MKKCPKCSKTFDDDKRFCQIDGTPLVDDMVEPEDMYKTMVSPKFVKPLDNVSDSQKANPMFSKPVDEDILQIPETYDPMKTMVAPDLNREAILNAEKSAPVEKPSYSEPSLSPPDFGSLSASSPFEESKPPAYDPFPMPESEPASPFNTPPSSPPMSAPPAFELPAPAYQETPSFDQNAYMNSPADSTVPDQWAPPPPPVSNWENQDLGSNTPFNPPVASVEGQNKTLAIVSLICGVLSMICCVSVATGPAALITGYMAKNNIDAKPEIYGGRTLALAGMITGGIGTFIGLLGMVFWLLGIGGNLLR